ncbi:MAG: preprotein translocase subunit SecE [bacterium]|nr:preprotein translocase subunit SecE [bacterium]
MANKIDSKKSGKKIRKNATQPEKKKLSVKKYVEETKLELKKVSWPDRQTVIRASLIILVIVISMTLFITIVDLALSKAFVLLKKI